MYIIILFGIALTMTEQAVDVDKELLPFLSSTARHDLKFIAIKYFVGKLFPLVWSIVCRSLDILSFTQHNP